MYVVGVGVLDDPFSVYRYTCFGLSGTPAPTKNFPTNYNLNVKLKMGQHDFLLSKSK